MRWGGWDGAGGQPARGRHIKWSSSPGWPDQTVPPGGDATAVGEGRGQAGPLEPHPGACNSATCPRMPRARAWKATSTLDTPGRR